MSFIDPIENTAEDHETIAKDHDQTPIEFTGASISPYNCIYSTWQGGIIISIYVVLYNKLTNVKLTRIKVLVLERQNPGQALLLRSR